jgi:hypothetical protein
VKKTILLLTGQDDRESARYIRRDDGSLEACFPGNVPLKPAFEEVGLLEMVILGISGNKNIKIGRPDLVINLICDADANQQALLEADSLVKQLGKPVINHPEKVMKTGRQSISQIASDINGLVTPHVVIVRPRRLKEIEDLWRSGAIPADFLIRPLTGESHGGKGLLRVASEAELGALEQYAFDGGAFSITPFVDYRSEDGYYRKYRLIFINGEAYPRHLLINSHWMIHASTRLSSMTSREDLQAEEQRFVTSPRDVMGQVAWAALHELARRTKLNFVGMDFSLMPDGRSLLFECNAGMNVLDRVSSNGFAYLMPVIDRIETALANMVERRV